MTSQELLRCGYCSERIPFEQLNPPSFTRCAICGKRSASWVFPAYYRAEIEGQAAPAREASQASCFFHPDKAAELACDGCGRFLCKVCDIHIGNSHLCTSCLQNGKSNVAATKLDNERVLHDSITLSLAAFAPIVFWPVVPFTAPYALYRAIRHYHTPSSIVRRNKWRLIVAMLLSTVQIIGIVAGIILIVKAV